MRRVFLITCVLILISLLSMAGYIYAEADNSDSQTPGYGIETSEIQYTSTPINKLGRGAINTVTCWAEVPAGIFSVSKRLDPLAGCTLGLVEGLFNGILRGLTGIYDAVTFIIPPYNKPLMKPEYALQSVDDSQEKLLW